MCNFDLARDFETKNFNDNGVGPPNISIEVLLTDLRSSEENNRLIFLSILSKSPQ